MGNIHPITRLHKCYKKVRHASFQEANAEAVRLKLELGHPLQVYHCETCLGFHVGHAPSRPPKRVHGSLIRAVQTWRDPDRDGEPLTEEEIIERARVHHALRRARTQSRSGKPQCEVIVCGKRGPHRCENSAMRDRLNGHRVCSFHGIDNQAVAVFTAEEAIAIHRSKVKRLWLTEQPA